MAEHRLDKKDGWQRYDWQKIELEYIFNPELSLRGIAKKYGCNLKTVAKHSVAGDWAYKRQETLYKISRLTNIKVKVREVERSVLDDINDIRTSYGLEAIEEIGDNLREKIREEVEKMY